MVPSSQTPFALDATFGYKSSNLRDYVLEKGSTRFGERDIFSITIDDICTGGTAKVTELQIPRGSVVIVNAAAESDMAVFAARAIGAEQQGKRYLYRTGAAFVSSRLGIGAKVPRSAEELDMDYHSSGSKVGNIIIAGLYVPKNTAQLQSLQKQRGRKIHVIELGVGRLIEEGREAEEVVSTAFRELSKKLEEGQNVLAMLPGPSPPAMTRF
ncbi:hypothetical protein V494_04648 [Pseudogymnoascus sp. VKM F-4513 (FW-928)]|nr:hypothetical protein V494_04648 [Pseudogymnoascus sp. VKM F-4513 (FW-928)]